MNETGEGSRSYWRLATQLARRIRDGEFAALGRLPSERELADRHGVSRPTVRDALIMLEVQGLIEVRHGSGAHILGAFPASDPGETEAEPAGPFALLEARQWVEAQVARCAALAATDADRAAIVELAQAYRAAAHDSGREALDARFHQAIARATHNDELALLVEQLWRRKSRNPMWRRLSRRPRDTRYRARWEEDHDAVVAALLRRDAEGAYVAMWSHIEHVKALLAEEEGADTPIARRPAPGPDDAAAGAIALRPPGLKGS